MSQVQKRHRSRGSESILMNALTLGLMLAGTVVAMLVMIAAVGTSLGIFSF